MSLMKSYSVTIVTVGHQTVLYKLSAELCSRNKRTATRDKRYCLKNSFLYVLWAVLHLIYENDARCEHIRSAFSIRGLLEPVRSVSLTPNPQ